MYYFRKRNDKTKEGEMTEITLGYVAIMLVAIIFNNIPLSKALGICTLALILTLLYITRGKK
jgi:hypothetical protein